MAVSSQSLNSPKEQTEAKKQIAQDHRKCGSFLDGDQTTCFSVNSANQKRSQQRNRDARALEAGASRGDFSRWQLERDRTASITFCPETSLIYYDYQHVEWNRRRLECQGSI